MYEPKVSVIIVSRDRPDGLARLLTSLRFQFYKNFEVIVVSNALDIGIDRAKHIYFEKPNISAARNRGIEEATGDLIAFCDDDAVPEPTWLEKLIIPFQDETVGVAGGFVRGRNGIDFQWKAQQVDLFGFDRPLEIISEADFQIVEFADRCAPKVQGTNCVFRTSTLISLGGFDEHFEFFLDETDVCMRATRAGWKTAIVPLAEVQHGFEESDRRTANRVPKSLFVEGQSKAYFCKKHAEGLDVKNAYSIFEDEQRKRLLRLFVDGFLSPKDIKALLASLQKGFRVGQGLAVREEQFLQNKNRGDFVVFIGSQEGSSSGEAFLGSLISKRVMIAEALRLSSYNIPCTVLYLSFTTLFHRRYFDMRGFWVQAGGLFGKSNRKQPYFQLMTVLARGVKELAFLKNTRKIEKISFFRFKRLSKVIKTTKNNVQKA